jgi:CBS domain-containing protein
VRISGLLRAKGSFVATVPPDATVAEVIGRLAHHGVGALVVSDNGRRCQGIVSERDIVLGIGRRGATLLDDPVACLMTVDVRTCAPEDECEYLMQLMTEHRVRHVPVLVEGELAGIISIGDVVKARVGELERERTALVDYVSGRA